MVATVSFILWALPIVVVAGMAWGFGRFKGRQDVRRSPDYLDKTVAAVLTERLHEKFSKEELWTLHALAESGFRAWASGEDLLVGGRQRSREQALKATEILDRLTLVLPDVQHSTVKANREKRAESFEKGWGGSAEKRKTPAG